MGRPPGSKDKSPRAPIPDWRRCTAVSKQTGLRCGNAAVYGGWTCRNHGGAAKHALEKARQRLEDVLPLAITRLIDLLNSTDERVVLMAAKDLADRLGARVPDRIEMTGIVGVAQVEASEVADLVAQLRATKALAGPTKEECIVAALARANGVPDDAPYQEKLDAALDATVGVEAEVVGQRRHAERVVREHDVEDAEIVIPQPLALPPAGRRRRAEEPDDGDTLVLSNGASWPASGLSPGGGRRSR